MKQYFIDFENINSNHLMKIDFTDDSVIHLFYTDSVENIKMSALNHIIKTKAQLKTYHVSNGYKNALDFQLSTYLGFIIANSPSDEFIIVSRDQGFDRVVKFWQDNNNIKIKRLSWHNEEEKKSIEVQKVQPVKNTDSFKRPKVTLDELKRIDVCGFDRVDLFTICKNSTSKEEIHNKIEKICKSSNRSARVYKSIRPLLIKNGYV